MKNKEYRSGSADIQLLGIATYLCSCVCMNKVVKQHVFSKVFFHFIFIFRPIINLS